MGAGHLARIVVYTPSVDVHARSPLCLQARSNGTYVFSCSVGARDCTLLAGLSVRNPFMDELLPPVDTYNACHLNFHGCCIFTLLIPHNFYFHILLIVCISMEIFEKLLCFFLDISISCFNFLGTFSLLTYRHSL